ncbi:hypothetical protein [Abyssisolibacter fermentans]|uniref:hypothetical protein n=1 Tax=Abyssisolibacter fermentans TaxID=1766203 RepID=UPI00082E7C8F|nr:hypothetical protein [Abyssisolibacter fermentans]
MKKTIFVFAIIITLMFMSTLSSAQVNSFSVVSTGGQQIYIVGPEPEPYVKYNDTNGDYYMRVRECKLLHGPADSDPIVKYKPFGLVYRTDNFQGTLGSSVSITESVNTSVTNTATVSTSLGISAGPFSSNVSMSQSTSVSRSVGTSVTKSYSSGYNFGFPASTAPSNCTKAEMGVGFQFATYRTIIDVKKLVNTMKTFNVVSKRYINECSICNGEHPGGIIPGHFHDGPVGWYLDLEDGTTVFVDEMIKDSLVALGMIDENMTIYKKSVEEWKYEQVYGTVKLPIDTMVTIYYDANGNILDKDGNIVN